MSNYLPPGCFAKPIKVGDISFNTIWHANSLPEFCACEVGKPNRRNWKGIMNKIQHSGFGKNQDGVEVKSTAEAMEVKEHKVIADKIREYSDKLPTLEVPRKKMKRVRSFDDGEEVDVDRFLDDKSDYWVRYKKDTHSVGIGYVCIWIHLATAARRSEEQMLWRGVAASALADALDRQGHTVEIRGYIYGNRSYPSFRDGSNILLSFPIKQENDKLVLEKACVPLCWPGWYRSWGFKAYLLRPDVACCDSLSRSVQDSIMPKEALLAGADDIFVTNIWTEQAAKDFLHQEVERLKNKLKGVDCYV